MKKTNSTFIERIEDSSDVWDSRELGASEEHAKEVDKGIQASVDKALSLKMTSIRLSQEMIDDLKVIAELNGFRGYQTLIKNVLDRFVTSEMKRCLREALCEKKAEEATENNQEGKKSKVA